MNRRGISRRVLARHYAAERRIGARCKTEPRLWNSAEAGWAAAASNAEAALAAAPAFALCAECPRISACKEWAETDRYTGLAAGLAWIRGKSHPKKFDRVLPARQAS